MVIMTPAERLAAVARARADYDTAQAEAERQRGRLMAQIGKALDEGAGLPPARRRELGPSAIGRAAKFTREYVAQIRAAKGGSENG